MVDMAQANFQAGGPLPADSWVYIVREADTRIIRHLRQMQYVSVTEPRLTGKTSLIFRLRAKLDKENFIIAYVSAESLDRKDERSWYTDLWKQLSPQLGDLIESEQISSPGNATEWRELLRNLASQARKTDKRLVIAIDEIGALLLNWMESFFQVLRMVYTTRAVDPAFENISFILAGSFEPARLIENTKVSPFNVAQQVGLPDFSAGEIQKLADHLKTSSSKAGDIAKRIYYWTEGQPYLSQKICNYLAEKEGFLSPEAVDQAVERLQVEDDIYIPGILRRLQEDQQSMNLLQKIRQGEKIPFWRSNPLHSRLYLTGAISGAEIVIDNKKKIICQIRNRILQQALVGLDRSRSIPHDEQRVRQTTESLTDNIETNETGSINPAIVAAAILSFLAGIITLISAIFGSFGGLLIAAVLIGLIVIGIAFYMYGVR